MIDPGFKDIVKDASQRMDKSVEAMHDELHNIRTGKATTALLEGIKVDYYGTPTPINQVGNLNVLDPHTLNFTPWDKNALAEAEKAIRSADIGLNPVNDGTNLRIPIPPLTEERRKELVKIVKKYGEDAKVAVRNVRRDANDHIKKKQKEDSLSEDSQKEAEEEVQKLTDKHTEKIDELIKKKEAEVMEV
ncbi:MAG: ribosome recycling factor [Ignavibacteriales bacterium]|nr:ribosome recycling factor [Ignavibacteriales bacterium]